VQALVPEFAVSAEKMYRVSMFESVRIWFPFAVAI
jgi:hypothetical protein